MNSKFVVSNIPDYYVTDSDVENLLYKAGEYGVGEVLLGPSSVSSAIDRAKKMGLAICVSIGYPSGAYFAEAKAAEIAELMELYPEVETYYVVLAEGAYLSKGVAFLQEELALLMSAVDGKGLVAVVEIAAIIRHGRLSEFLTACRDAGAKGVLVSTGFYPYKASYPSAEDVRKCRDILRSNAMLLLGAGLDADEALLAGCDKVVVTSGDMDLLSQNDNK